MFEKGLHPYSARHENLRRQAEAPILPLPILGVSVLKRGPENFSNILLVNYTEKG
jgi:hypothetical protein